MLCIPSAETALDPRSMDHDTHNLKKKQVDTNHHVGSIAVYTQRHTYMQHQIPAAWIPQALHPGHQAVQPQNVAA